MTSIGSAIIDLKRLDLFAGGATSLHRLDACAKVFVTMVFTVLVLSHGKYEVSSLLPFFLFPVVVSAMSGIPAGYLLRKIAVVCPLAVVVGLFNPLFDRHMLLQIGPLAVSGGWISLLSIVLRSVLTVSAVFTLIGTTGFSSVCQALGRMGMPNVFVMQLIFLGRYMFVLAEEADRTGKARSLRSWAGRGAGMENFGSLAGHLLLRTWDRAERIHKAMLSRGFGGTFHRARHQNMGMPEYRFIVGWGFYFILARSVDLPRYIGKIAAGIL